jgi:hypothetical protein
MCRPQLVLANFLSLFLLTVGGEAAQRHKNPAYGAKPWVLRRKQLHGTPTLTGLDLLQQKFLLQIPSRLLHILRLAEIPPIVFIGPEPDDFLSVARKP